MDHWGGGMVDHLHGGSWLAGRGGDSIRGCAPTGVSSGLGVDRVLRSLGYGVLAAALEAVALAVHLQDVHVVDEPVQQRSGEPF